VVERFINGLPGVGSSLKSDGEVLKSFDTMIARRVTDGQHVEILLSGVWYSHSTTKHTGMVVKSAGPAGAKVVRVTDLDKTPAGLCLVCKFVNCVCHEHESTEPEEGDYTTEDYKVFYQYGKAAVRVQGDPHAAVVLSDKSPLYQSFHKDVDTGCPEHWQVELVKHMVKSNYFPDLWVINDHGNRSLVNVYTGEAVRSYV
jgi:hypothetical protein